MAAPTVITAPAGNLHLRRELILVHNAAVSFELQYGIGYAELACLLCTVLLYDDILLD